MKKNSVTKSLNAILASLEVLEYKLEAIHWNETWEWFLYLHPMFWDLYEKIEMHSDLIAERIRQLGWNTLLNLSDVVKESFINEKEKVDWIKECVKYVRNDFKLFEWIIKEFSEKLEDDLATQQILIDLQMFFSQQIFLLSSELEEKDEEDKED